MIKIREDKKKDLVEQYHQALPERIRKWLENERVLTTKIIDRFRLGWDGRAITIPIFDRYGNFAFFKFRKDPKENNPEIPKYWYEKGKSAELYGWEHFRDTIPEKIIICEGELDKLTLESNGFPAVTSTGGAGTFKEEWVEVLKNIPEVFICFDNDEAGREGAEKVGKLIPKVKIVYLPSEVGEGGDITDFFVKLGKSADGFRELLEKGKTLDEIEIEEKLERRRANKSLFPPLSSKELIEILGLTVKKDEVNKLLTFLCELSAYTESSQFNISFNAPSSTGKSYIPIEIASLFPKEDVRELAYCSPTAFFHDIGTFIKEKEGYIVDLERKILIFLDQPHNQLLGHLRPLLSHDKKEIQLKITDKSQKFGLKTKNIFVKGFPSVIFCTGNLKIDEQEVTRFLLLSPETNQEKIREAVCEKIKKETDIKTYLLELESTPERQLLKDRIKAIREEHITEIKLGSPEKIKKDFLKRSKVLKPRHMRDIGRVISLIKAFALLNLWHREAEGLTIIANEKDIEDAFRIWDTVSESQEFNLPPYVYNLFLEVILPAYEEKKEGITRKEVMQKHFEVYERVLADWQLRQQIIPMLETAGLVIQEPDPNDKRRILISPVKKYSELRSGVSKN